MRILISVWLLLFSLLICGGSDAQMISICPGTTKVLKANTVTPADAAGGYLWFRDGVMIGNAATAQDSLVISDPGSYTLITFNAAGCSSAISDPFIVEQKVLKAVNDNTTAMSGIPTTINFITNDIQGCAPIDTGLITIISDPLFGTLSSSPSGSYTYYSIPGYSGADSFTYTITDNLGNISNIATVYITVNLNGPLPIILSQFVASKLNEQEALLSWRTQSERNSSTFIIERSADGRTFKSIGLVNAAGNSNTNLDYEFVDALPLSGNNFYRLKLTDIDGTSSFSDVQMLNFEERTAFQIYPNPVAGKLYIKTGHAIPQQIQLVDLSGRSVLDFKPETNNVELDMQHYIAGTYFVKIRTTSGQWYSYKIVKQ